MCIVADSSNLTNTKIYSYQKSLKRHGFVYSNTAESFVDKNSMILPIPSDVKNVQMFDGTKMKEFLDFANQCCPKEVTRGISKGLSRGIRIEKIGKYTVTYLSHSQLYSYLETADFEISEEMAEFLLTKYKNWSFISCEWEGKESIESQPIWIEFDTFYPSSLYFPTMDGHKDVPEQGKVERDHLIIASALNSNGFFEHPSSFGFDNTFDCVRLDGNLANGDTWVKIQPSLAKSFVSNDSYTSFNKRPESVIYY